MTPQQIKTAARKIFIMHNRSVELLRKGKARRLLDDRRLAKTIRQIETADD
jgi:hypothetical protein